MHLFSQYNDHEQNYKPVSGMCFSFILSQAILLLVRYLSFNMFKLGVSDSKKLFFLLLMQFFLLLMQFNSIFLNVSFQNCFQESIF